MGLDDFSDNDVEESSGKRKYVRMTTKEMGDFLSDRSETWEEVKESATKELVAETQDFFPENDSITLKLYTTIDERTGRAREKGADAMRLVVYHKKIDRPIGGRKKTLRIETWKKNLSQKIDDLMDEQEDYVTMCSDCGSIMVERSGRYGDFLGCSKYPDCDHTEQIDG